MKTSTKQAWFYDPWIVWSTVGLVLLGLLLVASASLVISDKQYGYPFHYVLRQAVFLWVGIGAAWIATRIPMSTWFRASGYILLGCLVLLALVLVPGIGHIVNGSRRWLGISVFSFQVSEFAKLSAILYLASYLVRFDRDVKQTMVGFLKPAIVLAIFAYLLLLEPDFGAIVVIASTFMVLLFMAGVRLRIFILLVGVRAIGLGILAVIAPYRMARLTGFLNPWAAPYGSGYQLTQSLIAFGRGGFWGMGLGNSVQKLFYLPEAHTDFVFAVLGEELGVIGCVVLLALMAMWVGRAFWLGITSVRQEQLYAAYVAYGLGWWVAMQTCVNVGVNVGVLPTKGLTLPLVSYGGTSLLMHCIAAGILLRIAYECTLQHNAWPVRSQV